jgi:hypothetical protein
MATNPIIQEIQRQGALLPASVRRRYIAAALETGRVETNFTNPSGGDADSAGWRQERASLYRDPTNVRASVSRFFQELAQKDRGQPSYELAADRAAPSGAVPGQVQDRAAGGARHPRRRGTGELDSRGSARSITDDNDHDDDTGRRQLAGAPATRSRTSSGPVA